MLSFSASAFPFIQQMWTPTPGHKSAEWSVLIALSPLFDQTTPVKSFSITFFKFLFTLIGGNLDALAFIFTGGIVWFYFMLPIF